VIALYARRVRVALAATVVTVMPLGAACGAPADRTEPATTLTDTIASTTMSAPAAAGPGATVSTIGAPAVATTPADRVDPPLTTCQRIAAAVDARHPGHDVQVIVRTDEATSTDAVVEVATRAGTVWTCGQPMAARIGRAGFRVLADRRSGDGTTPAGVFPLATMTAPDGQRFSFFGNAPDPGVTAGTYRAVRAGDCFGATPNTTGYGHLRNDTACAGADDEYLPRFVRTYTTVALIGANMEPDVSGDAPGEVPYAAAIFLHHHNYVSGTSGATRPTSGCVSLAQADLTSVLLALTPTAVFSMGTTAYLLAGA
jgi:L,D-peptidoglycan transpeptidase YkuD (ErfK/YbiS/YcfS/YnhG family)